MCCNFEGMLPEDLFDVKCLSNTLEKIKLVKPTATTLKQYSYCVRECRETYCFARIFSAENSVDSRVCCLTVPLATRVAPKLAWILKIFGYFWWIMP